MKICIPIKDKIGIKAKVSDHFGSAPYFLIYDDSKETFELIKNLNEHHVHGACQPIHALEGVKIDAVVCKGMGARAVLKLNEGGIKTYRSDAALAGDIIKRFRSGGLEEITVKNACKEHICGDDNEK